jgi:peptide-methionine (R)-S-oxide reductase
MKTMFEPLKETLTRRRALWITPLAFGGMAALYRWGAPKSVDSVSAADVEVTIVEFDDKGTRGATVKVKKIVKPESEWRKELSRQQFQVTRNEGTDTPFTGTYYKTHDAGLFRCVCCATALFNSDTKFDSGTGWPSFWQPIAAENVATKTDNSFGSTRTEVKCKRCDAHLGHVFDDGPRPTGLRYCMNESSLKFIKKV